MTTFSDFADDHSRVKLLPTEDDEGSDYINANYIQVRTISCCLVIFTHMFYQGFFVNNLQTKNLLALLSLCFSSYILAIFPGFQLTEGVYRYTRSSALYTGRFLADDLGAECQHHRNVDTARRKGKGKCFITYLNHK